MDEILRTLLDILEEQKAQTRLLQAFLERIEPALLDGDMDDF